MRGTIDASTNVHTTIGSQTNISGPVRIQLSPEQSKPSATELIDKARASLESGNYQVARELTKELTSSYPEVAEGQYLRALAVLRGRRPKTLALDEVQAIERLLLSAIHLHRQAHYLYCLALLRSDFYSANRLRMPPPTLAELVRQAETAPTDSQEVRFMLAHVPVSRSSLVLYIERVR